MLHPMHRRQHKGDDLSRSPWYERDTTAVVATLLLLFALVISIRVLDDQAGSHAVALLFVFPVSLMALTWGVRGGLAGAGLAVVAMVLPETLGEAHLDAVGWTTRVSALVLLGGLLGNAQDRSRAHQRHRLREQLERDRLICRAAQATAAAEISDGLVQGMSSAKWLIEAGSVEAAVDVLAETIEQAQEQVSAMVDRTVGEPAGSYLRVALPVTNGNGNGTATRADGPTC
jgi:K+-sensing histidine kinase KdpD